MFFLVICFFLTPITSFHLTDSTPPIYRDVFPKPEIRVVCLADGVQVDIHNTDASFSGVLYVKGHSNDERCRKIVPQESATVDEVFKVNFGECGLIHINVSVHAT